MLFNGLRCHGVTGGKRDQLRLGAEACRHATSGDIAITKIVALIMAWLLLDQIACLGCLQNAPEVCVRDECIREALRALKTP